MNGFKKKFGVGFMVKRQPEKEYFRYYVHNR
jgi:hypothetical protein